PGSNSFRAMGTASFKSFCPGSTRTSFAASCTTTVTSPLLSVVNTMLFPEIDLMVPTGRAAFEAACPLNAAAGSAANANAPRATQAIPCRSALLLFKLQISIGKPTPPDFFRMTRATVWDFRPASRAPMGHDAYLFRRNSGSKTFQAVKDLNPSSTSWLLLTKDVL